MQVYEQPLLFAPVSGFVWVDILFASSPDLGPRWGFFAWPNELGKVSDVEAMKTECGVAVLQKNSKWSKQSSNWNWGRATSPFAVTSNIKFRRSLTAEIPSAGMNTLRIWGGGIFMPDEFYDTCDELGLIVAGPHMTALAKNANRGPCISMVKFQGTCCKKHPEKLWENLWVSLWSSWIFPGKQRFSGLPRHDVRAVGPCSCQNSGPGHRASTPGGDTSDCTMKLIPSGND